jgi:glutamate mutase epsilon subunit
MAQQEQGASLTAAQTALQQQIDHVALTLEHRIEDIEHQRQEAQATLESRLVDSVTELTVKLEEEQVASKASIDAGCSHLDASTSMSPKPCLGNDRLGQPEQQVTPWAAT